MFGLISKFLTKSPTSTKKAAPAPRKTSLELEALEARAVPAFVSGGNLYIYGTNANDSAGVNYYGSSYLQVIQNGSYQYFSTSSVYSGKIFFYGYDGNDYFVNNTYLQANAYGMNGNDTLYGGYSADVLDGGYGSDYLYGRQGNDTMFAGYDYAYNVMYGGDHNDYMYGGYGVDYMYGENGNDYMYGRSGNDQMFGGYGKDVLYGEAGNDILDGGDDGVADYLNGGSGYDKFQRDMVWSGWYWYNRDYPADFNSSYDQFYG
jgi:Ca2+-binding RTX toxin-like protein